MIDPFYASLSTLDCFPLLYCRISMAQIRQFSAGDTVEMSVGSGLLLYGLSGIGRGHFQNARLHADKDFAIQKGHLHFLESSGRCGIHCLSGTLTVLLIIFSFHSLPLETDCARIAPMLEDYRRRSLERTPLRLSTVSYNLPFHLQIEANSLMDFFLSRIVEIAKAQNDDYLSRIEELFPSFFIQWMRFSPKELDTSLRHVDTVWISNETSDQSPLKAEQYLEISNIEHWFGNPAEDRHSIRLRRYLAHRCSYRTNEGSIRLERLSCPEQGEIARLYTRQDSYYSVLFHTHEEAPLDLYPYRNQCYLRFSIRSNMPIRMGVSSYSCRFWTGVGHIADYTQSDCDRWKQYTIPVLSPHQLQHISEHVAKATVFVRQNLHLSCSLKDVAQATDIRPSYLSKQFRKQLDISVSEYVRNLRIFKACSILGQDDASYEKLAFDCGFYDVSHFTKLFMRQMGVSPKAYRCQHLPGHREEDAE